MRRPTGLQYLGAAVVALAVLGGVETWRSDRATDGVTDCLKTYGDNVAEAIQSRAEATDRAQAAEDGLFEAFLGLPPTDAGRQRGRELFSDYVAARKRARAERDAHPFPPPPRVSCPG